jgi:hypothetical protein
MRQMSHMAYVYNYCRGRTGCWSLHTLSVRPVSQSLLSVTCTTVTHFSTGVTQPGLC